MPMSSRRLVANGLFMLVLGLFAHTDRQIGYREDDLPAGRHSEVYAAAAEFLLE